MKNKIQKLSTSLKYPTELNILCTPSIQKMSKTFNSLLILPVFTTFIHQGWKMLSLFSFLCKLEEGLAEDSQLLHIEA